MVNCNIIYNSSLIQRTISFLRMQRYIFFYSTQGFSEILEIFSNAPNALVLQVIAVVGFTCKTQQQAIFIF